MSLGQEGKCFLTPERPDHPPLLPQPWCSGSSSQRPASERPAYPAGGLTFPGDADAIQPGLLEAQTGVSALRKPRPDPPQEETWDTYPGPGQGLSGVDCN